VIDDPQRQFENVGMNENGAASHITEGRFDLVYETGMLIGFGWWRENLGGKIL
jgi:hypothetical protein